MKIANDLTELIGNTPLLKINSLSNSSGATILGKCEFFNPGGSVKDRIAKSMIEDGISDGTIKESTTIIEATSGNTGIALALICATKKMKLILTMPSSMSIERQKLLKALGARLELTPAELGMRGAIDKATELKREIKDSIIMSQFDNKSNPEAHRKTTAQEILRDTDGKVDIFVTAVGTGGTLTGVGEVLKGHNPNIQIITAEPYDSSVLSGFNPGPHKLQGLGAGFIPKILNTSIYSEVLRIKNDEALIMTRRMALEEGLLVGISSGANLCAAFEVAKRKENKGKIIVTTLCDTGERYLSTELFKHEE